MTIGVAGFEPTTSPTPRVRATRLRYTPILASFQPHALFPYAAVLFVLPKPTATYDPIIAHTLAFLQYLTEAK